MNPLPPPLIYRRKASFDYIVIHCKSRRILFLSLSLSLSVSLSAPQFGAWEMEIERKERNLIRLVWKIV